MFRWKALKLQKPSETRNLSSQSTLISAQSLPKSFHSWSSFQFRCWNIYSCVNFHSPIYTEFHCWAELLPGEKWRRGILIEKASTSDVLNLNASRQSSQKYQRLFHTISQPTSTQCASLWKNHKYHTFRHRFSASFVHSRRPPTFGKSKPTTNKETK